MKRYTFATCDDNAIFLEQIRALIQEMFEDEPIHATVDGYTDPLRLQAVLRDGGVYDALFLDIDMPRLSGLQLARWVRDTANSVPIVFVSCKESYVFETFRVQPFAFVRKGLWEEELRVLLPRLLAQLEASRSHWISLESGESTLHINPHRVAYVEVMDKSLHIIYENRPLTLRYPLSRFEALVEDYGFLRIHKSYLVNHRFLFSIEANRVILDDGTCLPMSKHRVKQVKAQYWRLVDDSRRIDSQSRKPSLAAQVH